MARRVWHYVIPAPIAAQRVGVDYVIRRCRLRQRKRRRPHYCDCQFTHTSSFLQKLNLICKSSRRFPDDPLPLTNAVDSPNNGELRFPSGGAKLGWFKMFLALTE